MNAVLMALCAGAGAYFLYSSIVGRTRGFGIGSAVARLDERVNDWFAQTGLAGVDRRQLGGFTAGLLALGSLLGWTVFGGVVAPVLVGLFAASFPVASFRQRRARRRAVAAEAWPRLIEEIRLLCGSLGRPIPQALLEVGKRGPEDLRPAFLAAEREWLISTDFPRTVAVLKEQLADPTADATCETLLIAHTVGGSDVDRRLAALARDRQKDLQGRKDARAKQAGVKFARRFVLVVPLGMAFAGMAIGDGRVAYSTPDGQLGVTTGLLTLAACWYWAGRLIRLPDDERVFRD